MNPGQKTKAAIFDLGQVADLLRLKRIRFFYSGGVERRWRFVIYAGVLLAIVLHLFYVYETRDKPVHALPLVDAAYYHQQAAGQISPDINEPYWQPPLFLWWLRGWYALFGAHPSRIRLLHAGISGMTALLTAFLGIRLLGIRLAWLPVFFTALCAPLLFFQAQLLPTGLGAMLLAAFTLAGIRFFRGGRPVDGLIAGVTAGAAALALANMLLLTPLLLIWTACSGLIKERLKALSAVAAGVVLCLLPVMARNYIASGYPVPVSINGGINLYLGNNPEYPDSIWIRPGLDWDKLLRMPFDYGATDSVEADRFFIRRTFAFWAGHPLAGARIMLQKAGALLNGREIPRNLDIYSAAEDSVILRRLLERGRYGWWPNGILLPFAVVGLVAALLGRFGWDGRWLAVTVLVYSAGIIMVFVTARYRAPVLPLLYLLAAAGLMYLWRMMRNGLIVQRCGWGILLVAAIIVAQLPLSTAVPSINFRAEHDVLAAGALAGRGDYGGAGVLYARALLNNPGHSEAWFGLGTVYAAQGQHAEAEECYHACLTRRSDHDGALVNMGVEKMRQGDLSGAEHYFNAAKLFNPRNARALHGAGICLMNKEEWVTAADLLQRSVELNPGEADVWYALGVACWRAGRMDAAGAALRKALELEPASAQFQQTLQAWESLQTDALRSGILESGKIRRPQRGGLQKGSFSAVGRASAPGASAILQNPIIKET